MRQMSAPSIGITGTKGVLNGLTRSGLDLRSTRILIQTIAKASNVPIDTSSPRILIGKIPAKTSATLPVRMVLTYGVLNLGWTFEKTGGNRSEERRVGK